MFERFVSGQNKKASNFLNCFINLKNQPLNSDKSITQPYGNLPKFDTLVIHSG